MIDTRDDHLDAFTISGPGAIPIAGRGDDDDENGDPRPTSSRWTDTIRETLFRSRTLPR